MGSTRRMESELYSRGGMGRFQGGGRILRADHLRLAMNHIMERDTDSIDNWRSKGDAFGLPLFERDSFRKELRVTARLKELAAGYEKSVAQLAIAWVLGNPAVTVALVGMRNEKELQENVAAGNWKLTPDDRTEIDRIFAEEGVPTYVDAEQAV